MNDTGEKLFYVHDPQLLSSQAFNEQCPAAEKSIVLGCYDGVGIYIFDVQDERLAGVEEVTAAHEMLHAAYDRLSPSRRNLSTSSLKRSLVTLRILDYCHFSTRIELAISINSTMNSTRLSGQKCVHCQKSLIVLRTLLHRSNPGSRLGEAYEKRFNDLKDQVERLVADLSLRRSEIERRENELSIEGARLQRDKAELDALAGQPSAYNARVPIYNAAVNEYNQNLATLRRLIEEFNALVAERNSTWLRKTITE